MSEFDVRSADTGNDRWELRFIKSRDDRIVLLRFLAACLVVVALINVVPAIVYWYRWNELDLTSELPRWIYLQVFAALVHVLYALFLIQIPDWASLRAVAYAMLAIAMSFGLLSTGLTVGDGTGLIPKFLGIDPPLVRRAGFWCVAMLCVATIASYLGGRESARWQRAEKLLFSMRGAKENSSNDD